MHSDRKLAVAGTENHRRVRALRLLEPPKPERVSGSMRGKRTPKSARVRNHIKAVGAGFARSLALEMTSAATISYGEVVRSLRRLEREYVPQLDGHPKFARELRRRIAEKLLEQAILHGCKLSVCTARLNAAARLGFTDVEQSAHYRLLYAKGAFARGHKQVAYRTATAVASDLERYLRRRRKNLLGMHLLKLTMAYLDHIRESESEGEPSASDVSSGTR